MKYMIRYYFEDSAQFGGIGMKEKVFETLEEARALFSNFRHKSYLFEYNPETQETGKMLDAKF